ncbi:MAG: DUF4292 domain-containing protein [Bacteroidales bacterium]|nr:DUF4292 domain-containing protein [Bacteroidales bacterium]
MKIFSVLKFKFFLVIITFFVFMSSCHLLTKTTKTNTITSSQLLDSVNKSFNDLTFRFSLKYKDKSSSYTAFGKAILYKDSLLYLSISPGLGITIAEIFINPDTLIVYFPLQNNYFAGNKELLLNKYGVALDFYSLQSIFTGNIFPYPYFYELNNYQAVTDSIFHLNNIIYNKNSKFADVVHNFEISPDFLVLGFKIFDYVLYKSLFVDYYNYKLVEQVFLPENIDLTLITTDTLFLNIKNKKFTLDSKANVDFLLPNDAQIIINN